MSLQKNNNSQPSENGKLQTSDVKTEDNNATSDDQVTTTVNSQQLNTDNTTSNATMSAAPINVSKDDLKLIVKK